MIERRDALDAAQRELEVIIGVPLNQLDELQVLRRASSVAPLIRRSSKSGKRSPENNPVLAASRHGVDAAKYEVETAPALCRVCNSMLRIRRTIPAATTRLTRNIAPTVSGCR